ncbi:MAG: HlyD family efflux transporter periplasmic adaptor subunit [Beijerinckiaceae bacterium]|nr:HlyD family efflux transporter periplasmic adaptor subunit [Beijerinckiaceae bacterium]
MDRRIIIAGMLAAAASIGWWSWSRSRIPGPPEWQGYAEADFVKVGPRLEGLLTSLYVTRGAKVAAGAPLFDQDDIADRAAADQAMRQLRQAEAHLANLQSAAKPTEIEQAEANLAEAVAARDKVWLDLQRTERLLKSGTASIQLADRQRADLRSATAKIQALEAALARLRNPVGRVSEITAQEAAVEAARAALQMAQWRLDQRHVVAPAAGVIADVLARPGETIPAGVPVVSLLPPENIFVRFFVPEGTLAKVHHGDQVKLVCDNCPGNLTATISFISPQAEYTPPVIYSETSRAKLVFKVEARPPRHTASMLNPGLPVAVQPAAAQPLAMDGSK